MMGLFIVAQLKHADGQAKSAVEKSMRRQQEKLKKRRPTRATSPVPWGCGLGWLERKDFESVAAYVAARQAAEPDYAYGHDGRLWAIV